ncbi:LysR substrate-binding domain-containing protein [Marinomonas epiphytica]
MSSKLPPLNAIKAFESAARKLSFSQAALELNVTQGAISKQIKLLEAHLQTALFDRNANGISLTQAGKQFLPGIMQALQTIQSSSAQLQQQHSHAQQLKINLIPSLATLWFIPRLRQLAERFPELTLQLEVGDGAFQFHQQSADIAVRCLPLSLTHEHAVLLCKEKLIPVIHPELAQQHPLQKPEDLYEYPLITHTTRPQLWPQFMSHAVQDLSHNIQAKAQYSHGFEHFFLSLEAAKNQQGVALVPDIFAHKDIQEGKLISPLSLRINSGYGYYFLSPNHHQLAPVVQGFKNWLVNELN